MAGYGLWIAVGFVILGVVLFRPAVRLFREIEFERARELFALQRERLELSFVELARASGKPKGLIWVDCQFESPVSFARDRRTSHLSGFVEVTIQFAAVEGGGMEDVAAVKERRNATAVFHYQHGQWGTGGRVLFNMLPEQALEHYREQFEPLSVPT